MPTYRNPKTGKRFRWDGQGPAPRVGADWEVEPEGPSPPPMLARTPPSDPTYTPGGPRPTEPLSLPSAPAESVYKPGGSKEGQEVPGAYGWREFGPTVAGSLAGLAAGPVAGRMVGAGVSKAIAPVAAETLLQAGGAGAGALATGASPQEAAGEALGMGAANLGVHAIGKGIVKPAIEGMGSLFRKLVGAGPEAKERLDFARKAGILLSLPEALDSPGLKAIQQYGGEAGVSGHVMRGQATKAGDTAADAFASTTVAGSRSTAPIGRNATASRIGSTLFKARETGARLGRQRESALWKPLEGVELDLSPMLQKNPKSIEAARQVLDHMGINVDDIVKQKIAHMQTVDPNFQASPADVVALSAEVADEALQAVPLGRANEIRSALLTGGRQGASQGLRGASQGASQRLADELTDAMEESVRASSPADLAAFKQAREFTRDLHSTFNKGIGRKMHGLEKNPEKIPELIHAYNSTEVHQLKKVLFQHAAPGSPEYRAALVAWDNGFDQKLKQLLGQVVEQRGSKQTIRFENLSKVTESGKSALADILDKNRETLGALATTPELGKLVPDAAKREAIQNLTRLGETLSVRTPEAGVRTSYIVRALSGATAIVGGVAAATGRTGTGLIALSPEAFSLAITKIAYSKKLTEGVINGFKSKNRWASRAILSGVAKEVSDAIRTEHAAGKMEENNQRDAQARAKSLVRQIESSKDLAEAQRLTEELRQLHDEFGGGEGGQ